MIRKREVNHAIKMTRFSPKTTSNKNWKGFKIISKKKLDSLKGLLLYSKLMARNKKERKIKKLKKNTAVTFDAD